MALLETVFEVAPPDHGLPPMWRAMGYYDARGACVASLDVARFDLLLDGGNHGASGIRLVAVHPDWRGRGLAREMILAALAAIDADDRARCDLVLLYAESPDLYHRYGFRSMPQHAFVGAAPAPSGLRDCRALDAAADRGLIERELAARAPISLKCAVLGAAGLFFDRVTADPDIRLSYLPGLDTIVAYEVTDETFVLVDVIAAEIPSLAAILGAIGARFTTIKTLFSPDRLDWHGEPVRDDTGLMIRGTIPPALTGPFMLPPTTEF